ncbi:Imm1 family immunity protein [Streptomyces cinereoruber]|uniref:Imm1 family immunity protein n=1 Tax=Streptomyces cinereoruber TaxID=67260 RepID=UPI0036313CBC
MTLAFHVDRTVLLEDGNAADEAIRHALENRSSGLSCDTVSFLYLKSRDSEIREASLTVALNHDNGYGGLVWYPDGSLAERLGEKLGQDFADATWVSYNPEPPEFDPEIVIDPWVPTLMNRMSALPVTLLKAALEEFCSTGTGERPESVEWTEGQYDGTLMQGS